MPRPTGRVWEVAAAAVEDCAVWADTAMAAATAIMAGLIKRRGTPLAKLLLPSANSMTTSTTSRFRH